MCPANSDSLVIYVVGVLWCALDCTSTDSVQHWLMVLHGDKPPHLILLRRNQNSHQAFCVAAVTLMFGTAKNGKFMSRAYLCPVSAEHHPSDKLQ